MQLGVFVGLMIIAGAMIAFQSPINAALARSVGVYNATFVSFATGVVLAGIVAALTGGGGSLRQLSSVPWWQWIGGALGVAYVTTIIVAVPRIGVTTMMVAALAGQLTTAMVIDHFGWFGIEARAMDWRRAMALPLLAAALYFMRR
ncbi:DMT family transporter [Sandaracinus amylolyticus]|uniref:DMT family transporter n=1 Tax=Sandaracinus amylolyticus TaxID=927083 RepID=UPI001F3580C7|nr:DMT family transporter [Sandaracinus amylolyticus]UJR78300.1 DMT family transporter [Sandaracinus amylolyticus]